MPPPQRIIVKDAALAPNKREVDQRRPSLSADSLGAADAKLIEYGFLGGADHGSYCVVVGLVLTGHDGRLSPLTFNNISRARSKPALLGMKARGAAEKLFTDYEVAK